MDLSDVDREWINKILHEKGAIDGFTLSEALLAFIAKHQMKIAATLGRLEVDVDKVVQMLNLGESDLDVSLAKLIDLRSGQAVIALREILDELRMDDRDELIKSILDEAVEEGLLEPESGLPESWEGGGEEPDADQGRPDVHWRCDRCGKANLPGARLCEECGADRPPPAEDNQTGRERRVQEELQVFLGGKYAQVKTPAGHHGGDLNAKTAKKLAEELTEKLKWMRLV